MKICYSLVLVVRNEETSILRTINSILNNDLNKKEYELIIVDGMSNDNTLKILKEIKFKNHNVKILQNKKKIVAAGLNIGIKISKGKYIIRLDGHKIYPKNYLRTLINFMKKNPQADNVGCRTETIPHNNSLKAKAIAVAVSCKYAVGNSKFRINKKKNIVEEVDTVPYGCFRKEVFDEIGFFDENFQKNQDDEFNLRLKKNNKKIYLINNISVKDFARPNFIKLFSMFFYYGLFKPMVWIKHKKVASLRNIIPAVNLFSIFFNLILIINKVYFFSISILLYICFLIFGSLAVCIKQKKIALFFYVFISLIIIHNAYALGNFLFLTRKFNY